MHFDRCARIGHGSYPLPAESVRKVLILRGTLRGKKALDSADSGLSRLACASVSPGQVLYQDRTNRSSVHGKEKVYGSIP